MRLNQSLILLMYPLEELLQRSDFVCIHVSLNEDTLHLIDASKIKLMKKTAFIINTSRGKVINEQDLIGALKNKLIHWCWSRCL